MGGTSSELLIENHGPSFAVEVFYCICRTFSPGRWRWRLHRGQRETDACQGTGNSPVVLGSTLPSAYRGLLTLSLGQPMSWLESFLCRMRDFLLVPQYSLTRDINAGKRQRWYSWEQCFLAGSSAVMAGRAWGSSTGKACLVACPVISWLETTSFCW